MVYSIDKLRMQGHITVIEGEDRAMCAECHRLGQRHNGWDYNKKNGCAVVRHYKTKHPHIVVGSASPVSPGSASLSFPSLLILDDLTNNSSPLVSPISAANSSQQPTPMLDVLSPSSSIDFDQLTALEKELGLDTLIPSTFGGDSMPTSGRRLHSFGIMTSEFSSVTAGMITPTLSMPNAKHTNNSSSSIAHLAYGPSVQHLPTTLYPDNHTILPSHAPALRQGFPPLINILPHPSTFFGGLVLQDDHTYFFQPQQAQFSALPTFHVSAATDASSHSSMPHTQPIRDMSLPQVPTISNPFSAVPRDLPRPTTNFHPFGFGRTTFVTRNRVSHGSDSDQDLGEAAACAADSYGDFTALMDS